MAAVFERLKEEVRRPVPSAGQPASGPLPARLEAERLWSVAVDVPLPQGRGVRGRLVGAVKRMLRKLMSWYVGPFASDQRNFNHTLLRLVDELHARLQSELNRSTALEAQLVELERASSARARRDEELEDRVLRLERARPTQRPKAAAVDGGTPLDYFAFEARMRGTTVEIRERQRLYVDDFRDAAPVLDVGCGRGEFLGLLRDAGVAARGVELDPDTAAFAAGEGLDVVEGDGLAYLEGVEDASLGGVFAAQVVEHLPPGVLSRFLELAARKLRPAGVLIAETINPLSPLSLRNYFSDLSHAQPLVPETLALLARQSGFTVEEIRYLHEPEERLEASMPALERTIRLLNEQVFAPLDYALVARKP